MTATKENVCYKETITVSHEIAEKIKRYMNVEPENQDECLGEDEKFDYEVTFPDGKRMAVQVCGVQYRENEPGNTAWSQAVLWDENGRELAYTDVSEDFLGEWELDYDGVTYQIIVRDVAEVPAV